MSATGGVDLAAGPPPPKDCVRRSGGAWGACAVGAVGRARPAPPPAAACTLESDGAAPARPLGSRAVGLYRPQPRIVTTWNHNGLERIITA